MDGNPVDVFYGDSSHLERQVNGSLWTSQADQDQIVFNLLGKEGYFVEMCQTLILWKRIMVGMGSVWKQTQKYWLGLAGRKCQVVGAVLGHQTMEEIQFKYGTKASNQIRGTRSDSGLRGGIVN